MYFESWEQRNLCKETNIEFLTMQTKVNIEVQIKHAEIKCINQCILI
jgi:hypothetical protein